MFFTRRFVPEIAAAIGEASGQPWSRAIVTVHQATFAAGSPYLGSAWRHEAGAALWDIGPHVLSVIVPLLGTVVEVRAEPGGGHVFRFATRHAGGANAEVSLSLHAERTDARNEYRFESDAGATVLPDPAFDRAGVYALAAGQLVRNIEGSPAAHGCDAAFGADVVRVLEAVERSAATGRPVETGR